MVKVFLKGRHYQGDTDSRDKPWIPRKIYVPFAGATGTLVYIYKKKNTN